MDNQALTKVQLTILNAKNEVVLTNYPRDVLVSTSDLIRNSVFKVINKETFVVKIDTEYNDAVKWVLHWIADIHKKMMINSRIDYQIVEFLPVNFPIIEKLQVLAVCDLLRLSPPLVRQKTLRTQLYNIAKGRPFILTPAILNAIGGSMHKTEPNMVNIAFTTYLHRVNITGLHIAQALACFDDNEEVRATMEVELNAKLKAVRALREKEEAEHEADVERRREEFLVEHRALRLWK